MNQFSTIGAAIMIAGVGGMMPADATARALFAYPLEGQSLEQENKDRLVCHSWAVDQTGYSPSGVPQGLVIYGRPPDCKCFLMIGSGLGLQSSIRPLGAVVY